MRVARYTTGEDPAYGIVEGSPGSEVVHALQGDPLYIGLVPGEGEIPLEEVRLLAPVIPRSKVIGIGSNYADHAPEMGNEAPAEPLMFLKSQHRGRRSRRPGRPAAAERRGPLRGRAGPRHRQDRQGRPRRGRPGLHLRLHLANDVTARDLQRATASGRAPRVSTRSARSGRGSRPISTPADLRLVTRLRRRGRPGRPTARHGARRRPARRARVGRVHAAAGRRDPHRDARRRRTGRAGQRVSVEIEGIGTLYNPFVRR